MKQPKAKQNDYKRYLESLRDKSNFYDSTYVRGHKLGEKKGLKKGIEKGREEGILVVAKNLKKAKTPVLVISKATGLSHEEIKKL